MFFGFAISAMRDMQCDDNCNGCTVCGGCTDCDYAAIQKCGEEDGRLFPRHLGGRLQFDPFPLTAYYHDQTGNYDAEKCVRQNHAYLWVINSNCEDVDGAARLTPAHLVRSKTRPSEQTFH